MGENLVRIKMCEGKHVTTRNLHLSLTTFAFLDFSQSQYLLCAFRPAEENSSKDNRVIEFDIVILRLSKKIFFKKNSFHRPHGLMAYSSFQFKQHTLLVTHSWARELIAMCL